MDIDLSFLSFLELYRTDVSERRVVTRRVVEPFDAAEQRLSGAVRASGRPCERSVRSSGR